MLASATCKERIHPQQRCLLPLTVIISCSRTIFLCLSICSSLISRIAVIGKPSFSASMRIFFNATKTPVCADLALKTCPYVPSPT